MLNRFPADDIQEYRWRGMYHLMHNTPYRKYQVLTKAQKREYIKNRIKKRDR